MYVLLITRLLRLVGRRARKPVNHTSWVAVVTPTDRPKSVRNRCVIELFCGVVYVVTLPFWHFCWCMGFCHRTESDLFLFLWHEKLYTTGNDSHIFLANLFRKQGMSSEYVMVDFICIGLLDLWGARTENYKMKNASPQWDSNPGPSAYEANALSVELLELINIDHLKVTAFYLSFLCKFTCTTWSM